MKIQNLLATALLVSFSIVAAAAAADTVALPKDQEARARAIHERVLKIDAHVDVLIPGTPARYGEKDGSSFASVQKLEKGGINAVAFAIAVGPGPHTSEGDVQARKEADEKLRAIQAFARDNAAKVGIARSAADIRRLHGEKKIAIIESFLNARSLGSNPKGFDEFYAAGVRLVAFNHAGNNAFADSSRPTGEDKPNEHGGLSPLGKEAVGRLNRIGAIIDVSQLTPAGVLQTVQLSKAPVIASHSAVRALVDNERNLSDAELDAIGKAGGVVHVPPFSAYLAPPPKDLREKAGAIRVKHGLPTQYPPGAIGLYSGVENWPEARQNAYLADIQALLPKATLRNYIDHIEYIVKRIGIDHVGIGTDFNHGSGIEGFANESDAFNVTRELVRRGYDEAQIAKIWGGNFLRVFERVEAVSKQLQKS